MHVLRVQNNFERGQKDEFEVTGSDVGQMTKIVIGHDNSGALQRGRGGP